ncbi:hypothetical protein SUDANB108_05582 [Streptomyces sp. enrichment culture]
MVRTFPLLPHSPGSTPLPHWFGIDRLHWSLGMRGISHRRFPDFRGDSGAKASPPAPYT